MNERIPPASTDPPWSATRPLRLVPASPIRRYSRSRKNLNQHPLEACPSARPLHGPNRHRPAHFYTRPPPTRCIQPPPGRPDHPTDDRCLTLVTQNSYDNRTRQSEASYSQIASLAAGIQANRPRVRRLPGPIATRLSQPTRKNRGPHALPERTALSPWGSDSPRNTVGQPGPRLPNAHPQPTRTPTSCRSNGLTTAVRIYLQGNSDTTRIESYFERL